jgi:hypothetical protein
MGLYPQCFRNGGFFMKKKSESLKLIYRYMRKISNREEANNYYKTINKGVDDFVSKTKAKPSEIHTYLSRNNKRFLKQLDLSDVEGVDNVLKDVLNHRKHMEDDKVITFESYSKMFEQSVNVGSPTVEHEKVLADKFGTSLGHIEIVDPQLHLFSVNDFGKNIYAIVYTDSEVEKVKSEVCKKIQKDIVNKMVSISDLDSVRIDPLKFWISDFIDISSLESVIESKVGSKFVLDYILSSFKSSEFGGLSFESSDFSYSTLSGFHIWFR